MRRTLLAALLLIVPVSAVPAGLAGGDARVEYLQTRRGRALVRLVWLMLSERKLAEARLRLAPELRRIEAAPEGGLSLADVRLLYLAGIVEEMAGATARRDELFASARRLARADEFTHIELGKMFEELHREDITSFEFGRVLELEPADSLHDVEALERLAQWACTNRRWPRAAELFERLNRILRETRHIRVPDQTLSYFEYMGLTCRGFALLEQRPPAWQEALERAERAWRLDPERIEAPLLGEHLAGVCPERARAEELRKTWRERSERTVEALKQRIAAEPREPHHYNALAWFCALLGRHLEEAVHAAERALELSPAEPAFLDTLAEVRFRRGEAAAAAATIRRVIDVCPFANDYYRHQLDRFEAARAKPKAAGVP